MRIQYLAMAAVIVFLGAGCRSAVDTMPIDVATVPPAAVDDATAGVGFGVASSLVVGGSVEFEDGLVVELTAINDSRCPAGVQCVWAGELAPVLLLSGGALAAPAELALGTARGLSGTVGDYRVVASDVTLTALTLVVTELDLTAAAHVNLMRVGQPLPEAIVSSPLVVTGEARGYWFFEASFPVKLYDANGQLLVVAPAQAQDDWMTEAFVPFSVTLVFDQPTTTTGTLVLEKDNPSGLPEHDDAVRLPVRF